MTDNGGIELDNGAQKRLNGYMEEVKKGLDEVDSKERKAVLEEIDNAIKEKIEILAAEKNAKKADDGLVEKVLEGFGSPSELARGYARVAGTGPGRVMKGLCAFEAFWAVLILVPGVFYLLDAYRFWYPHPDLVMYGQPILGTLFIVGAIVLAILISLQLRSPALRAELGPFALIGTLALGIRGLLSFGQNADSLLPGLPRTAANSVIIALGVFLILGCIWGFRSLFNYLQKARPENSGEALPSGGRRFSKKGKNIIVASTVVMVSLFVLAEGFLSTGGPYGNEHPAVGDKVYVSSEYVGGPFNASIEKWQGYTGEYWAEFYKIVYTVNGSRVEGAFMPDIRPALDWIRANTSSNATFLCWWDYGHMVTGYTGRNCVIYYPSKNILDTVADKKSIIYFEPEDRVKAVADIFLSKNSSDVQKGMEALGASHILTASRDASDIAWAFFKGAGLDPWTYISSPEGRQIPNDNAKDMFLFRIWNSGEFNGIRVDYKDIVSQVIEPA